MADEDKGSQEQQERSTAQLRQTMGMRRISSRPGGRKAPILLTIIVLIAIAIALLVTLAPWGRAEGAVDAFPPLGEGESAVLFLGDVLLGDAATGTLQRRGYDHPFVT